MGYFFLRSTLLSTLVSILQCKELSVGVVSNDQVDTDPTEDMIGAEFLDGSYEDKFKHKG